MTLLGNEHANSQRRKIGQRERGTELKMKSQSKISLVQRIQIVIY